MAEEKAHVLRDKDTGDVRCIFDVGTEIYIDERTDGRTDVFEVENSGTPVQKLITRIGGYNGSLVLSVEYVEKKKEPEDGEPSSIADFRNTAN